MNWSPATNLVVDHSVTSLRGFGLQGKQCDAWKEWCAEVEECAMSLTRLSRRDGHLSLHMFLWSAEGVRLVSARSA